MARGGVEASHFTPCRVRGGAARARGNSAPKVAPCVWSEAAGMTWGREKKLRMDTLVRPQEDRPTVGWECVVMGERVDSRWWVNRDGSELGGKTKAR